MTYGDWSNDSGSARVEGDKLCLIKSSTTFCGDILRNPGGTREKENEYIWFFDSWGSTFSQVE